MEAQSSMSARARRGKSVAGRPVTWGAQRSEYASCTCVRSSLCEETIGESAKGSRDSPRWRAVRGETQLVNLCGEDLVGARSA